jgi:hypothetical protein
MSAIREAKSLDDVVAIINSGEPAEYFGGTDLRSPEQMAAEYAADAAENPEDAEYHLSVLTAAGARFDERKALAETETTHVEAADDDE